MPTVVRRFPRLKSGAYARYGEASDREIWHYAKANGFILVSQDADFADMATLYASPPKVIWLRCGNQPTSAIEERLRNHAESITSFEQDVTTVCWEIY